MRRRIGKRRFGFSFLVLLLASTTSAPSQNNVTGAVSVLEGQRLAGDFEVATYVPAPLAVRLSPAGTGFRPSAQERARLDPATGTFSLPFRSVRVHYMRVSSGSDYPVEIPAVPVRGQLTLPKLSSLPLRHMSIQFSAPWLDQGDWATVATALPPDSADSCLPHWAPAPYFEEFKIAPTVTIERAPAGQELWFFHPLTGAKQLESGANPPSLPAESSAVSRAFRLVSTDSNESLMALVTWGLERIPLLVVGSSGSFEIRAPAGDWEIRVHTFDGNEVRWAQTVRATESEPIQLELPRRAELSGRVLSNSGEPIPQALLWRAGEARWQTATAEDGTFRLRELPSATDMVLCIQDPSGDIHPHVLPALPAGRTSVDLRMPSVPRATAPQEASITGRVVDDEGRAAAGVQLELVPETTARGLAAWLAGRGSERAVAVAESDLLGVFELSGVLPAGRYRIVAHASGFSPSASDAIELYSADDRLDVGDLALSRGVTLAGTVATKDGKGVAGALVSVAMGVDGLWFQLGTESVADDRGEFVFENVPSGVDLEVRARSTDGAGTSRRISLSEDLRAIRLVLGPTATLEVLVRDAQGLPIAGAEVMTRPLYSPGRHSQQSPRIWAARTDDSGVAHVAGVECVPLQVRANATGYASATTPVNAGACAGAGPIPVVLQLQAQIRIAGRVLDGNGLPVSDALVAVDGASTTTDALGSFSLPASGGGMVRVRYGNEQRGWATVELSVGTQDIRHDLVLP